MLAGKGFGGCYEFCFEFRFGSLVAVRLALIAPRRHSNLESPHPTSHKFPANSFLTNISLKLLASAKPKRSR
jgi:hypothetical protein